jgi:hypothetical protein
LSKTAHLGDERVGPPVAVIERVHASVRGGVLRLARHRAADEASAADTGIRAHCARACRTRSRGFADAGQVADPVAVAVLQQALARFGARRALHAACVTARLARIAEREPNAPAWITPLPRRLPHTAPRIASRIPPMSRLDSISDKVMDLVGHMGDSIRDGIPSRAGTLVRTGAALGMAKTGSRVAGHFVRRNPAVLLATVVGVGAAWYAVHRYRRKQQAGETLEGRARRIQPNREARESASSQSQTTGASSGGDTA